MFLCNIHHHCTIESSNQTIQTSNMNETGNNKYSKDFKVPEGFDDILRNLTREVLRAQPKDINKFGENVQQFSFDNV